MNITNKLLYDEKITLAAVSGEGIAEDLLRPLCTGSGAEVVFLPITAERIARAESLLGETLEDGFDKYLVFVSETAVEIYYSTSISKLYAAHKLLSLCACALRGARL